MRRAIAPVLAVAVLGVAACGNDSDESSPVTTPDNDVVVTMPTQTGLSPTGTPAPPQSATVTPQDIDLSRDDLPITAADAISRSAAATGKGRVYELEIEWSDDHSAWVWNVETRVGTEKHDVDIHADSGAILSHERDDSDDEKRAVDLTSPMTPAQAMQKALKAQSGRVSGWKLEWDDDRLEYEIDIESEGSTTEVTVDARSGKVDRDD